MIYTCLNLSKTSYGLVQIVKGVGLQAVHAVSPCKHQPVEDIEDGKGQGEEDPRHPVYSTDTVDFIEFSPVPSHKFSVFLIALQTEQELHETGSGSVAVLCHWLVSASGCSIFVFSFYIIIVLGLSLWCPVYGGMHPLQHSRMTCLIPSIETIGVLK